MTLYKLGLLPYQDTGVSFYRLIGPAESMVKTKQLEHLHMFPFSGANDNGSVEWSDKTYMDIGKDADAVMSTLIWDAESMLRAMNLRKWSGAKLIVDIDDNLYNIPFDNPSSKKAQQYQANWEVCLRMADGVTVSVPYLAKLYKHLNKNIYVNYNGLDFDYWDSLERPENATGKLRIGWRGMAGHKDDISLLEGVITALKKDYDFTFVTFGTYKPPFSDEHHPPIEFRYYPQQLANLRCDLAIVPLVDSTFNRSKSNLSWLEWSALKVPTVLSPTENHKGLQAAYASNSYEWYDQIEQLLQNATVRRIRGQAAYAYAKQHFSQDELCKPLAKWIKDLPYRTDLEPDK